MTSKAGALPMPDSMDSTSKSTFQLQTSSIRNSTPFKSKSADVFGSLEAIERKYESGISGRSQGGDRMGAEEEGEEEEVRLEGFIKRGCIFKKPKGLASGLRHEASWHEPGSASGLEPKMTPTGSINSGPDKVRLPSSHSSVRSLDSAQTTKQNAPASATTSSSSSSSEEVALTSSSNESVFRKPDKPLSCKDTKRGDQDRSKYSQGRGRGKSNLRFAPRGGRRPPDYILNPEKYTKYSLEETNMCGNAANRSIALGFLSDLRKRRMQGATEGEDEAAKDDCAKGQFVFRKPTSAAMDHAEHYTKRKAYGSVYKMPEYEVGRGAGTKHKRPKIVPPADQQEQAGGVGHGLSHPCTQSAFALEHLHSEQPMSSKESHDEGHSAQSEMSGISGDMDTDHSQQGESSGIEGASFRSRKGKGRKQLRSRQEDT